jgi:UDP-N-acetylmuramate--alanine ligase
MLDQAGLDPTVVNGGVINAYNSNARLGSGDWIVVEADESDGSFTKLLSTVSVVTNINFDHADNFESFEELRNMFITFVENIPFYGAAVLCADHPQVRRIAEKIVNRRVVTYGLTNENTDVSCENMILSRNGAEFDVIFSPETVKRYGLAENKWKNFTLSMYGAHNVQNALAVISVGLELAISEDNMRIALGSFMGVKRRFTAVGDVNGAKIIDDYAHHPVEIEAVLRAARNICSGRIFAVIQPHRHTRLRNFLPDFAKVLELSDRVFVTPIYSAGEADNGTDHFTLLNLLRKNNAVRSDFAQNLSDLKSMTDGEIRSDDFVIFLGAGDITRWADEFCKIG